jgi:hypothetical protein
MLEFAVFLYGLLAGYVLLIGSQNARRDRPNPVMVQAVGWGLLSMSSILATLLFAVAIAIALGATGPLVEALG